jgi:hypothetical protein
MILYVPNNIHSSQVTHICNKEVLLRHLQVKNFHAMKQPTQGLILERYA